MKPLLTLLCSLILYSSLTQAAVVIDVTESGGDVVATASGTINTEGLGAPGSQSINGGYVIGSGGDAGNDGVMAVGSKGLGFLDSYNINTTVVFATGGLFNNTSSSGSMVGIASFNNTGDAIFVVDGYISEAAISATSTWAGQTFASMGLIPGTYVSTWGNGANADSLTINIGTVSPGQTVTIAASSNGEEPNSDGEFTVTSSETAGAGGLTVNYSVDGASTATSGSDYDALSGSVLIPEGEITAVIPVTIIDDVEIEVTETVIVNLTSDSDYTLGSPSAATVNITDDEVAPPPPPPPPPQQPAKPVPAMGAWGLLLMVMVLGFFGIVANRRMH